jgi:hypothetical protein
VVFRESVSCISLITLSTPRRLIYLLLPFGAEREPASPTEDGDFKACLPDVTEEHVLGLEAFPDLWVALRWRYYEWLGDDPCWGNRGVLSRLSPNRWVGWPVPTSCKLTPYGSVNAIRVPFRENNV